jgi:hypothetical protein
MAAALLVIGLYPQPIIDTTRPAISALKASSMVVNPDPIPNDVPESGDRHARR